jgi:glutamyl-Q tRNA(Asp) synthetase
LVAAVGSYLDARAHEGLWLVRMEDVDEPRCSQSNADEMLRMLEAHGFEWEGEVLYQSRRKDYYQSVLDQLIETGQAYPCACTRKEIADSSLIGIDGPVYSGACRNGLKGLAPRAWRVRVEDGPTCFEDRLQGRQCQCLEADIGDFVIKRADGYFAYQLAVVVDDADQGISHIVRGADLLASTPRQIYLQQLLEFATPEYLHLPVVVNASGQKLSKQTLAPSLENNEASHNLWKALDFLGLAPGPELMRVQPQELLAWGVANWRA